MIFKILWATSVDDTEMAKTNFLFCKIIPITSQLTSSCMKYKVESALKDIEYVTNGYNSLIFSSHISKKQSVE